MTIDANATAFDTFWEWANKDRNTDHRTVPSDIHFVMTELLSREDWNDREKVNAAVEAYRNEKDPTPPK